MLLYPGDSAPTLQRVSSIAEGAMLTASKVELGCHVGTHADAPAHFLADGLTLDELGFQHFCGPAVVLDLPGRDRITQADLAGLAIPRGRHVLIRTRNSEALHRRAFDPAYCFVTPGAVRDLLDRQPLSIGFDYYSLDPLSEESFPAHLEVARFGIPVFVCLDLTNVSAGEYNFIALPLKLSNLEGFPVRAVLFP
jgi:arylformamidase